MIKITTLIFEVENGTMKLSRLITCMFREYVKKLYVKSCTRSHPSCPRILRLIPSLSMLQHLKYGSMAVFKNNFQCLCNVHAAEQHSLLHPLQNISQSHTKDLTHLNIQLLGHPPPPPPKKTVVGTSLSSQNPSSHDCSSCVDSLFPQPTPSLLL